MTFPTIERSFCTTREAATLLGVSVGTVQLWVESGLLKAWKTAGGHRRVLRESVDGLLHAKPQKSLNDGSAPHALSHTRSLALRVLVVEDDPSLLRLYQVNISKWPVPTELTLIDNAIEALLCIGRGGPDLLITDLHMPGMDGFAMLNTLAKAPETARTKVIAVTGLDAAEVQARGGVPPGVEILAKPIPFAQLLVTAQNLFRQLGSPV